MTRCAIPLRAVAGCEARTVEKAIHRLAGVTAVYVNSAVECAYVDYDPTLTTPTRIVQGLERAGFHAREPRQVAEVDP